MVRGGVKSFSAVNLPTEKFIGLTDAFTDVHHSLLAVGWTGLCCSRSGSPEAEITALLGVLDCVGFDLLEGVGLGNTQKIVNLEQYYLPLDAPPPIAGEPLLWKPGFIPHITLGLADLTAASWQSVVTQMWENETFAAAYRSTEANGRDWMGDATIRDYMCALSGVSDTEYITCAGKNEEIMARPYRDPIRQYTSSSHTYVLTAMFPFQVILGHFRDLLHGVHPSDVPTAFASEF
eukprot:gene26066-31924_t